MTIAEVMMRRKRAGLTQRELANALGWNQESLTDIERGRVCVTEETLVEIDKKITVLSGRETIREEVSAK